jgi:large subunit ribosomal protein L28
VLVQSVAVDANDASNVTGGQAVVCSDTSCSHVRHSHARSSLCWSEYSLGPAGETLALAANLGVSMAAVCEVCGRHSSVGVSISHSHRRTKRRWYPNIQRVRAIVGGSTRRVHVCTSCIRAGKVTKASR